MAVRTVNTFLIIALTLSPSFSAFAGLAHAGEKVNRKLVPSTSFYKAEKSGIEELRALIPTNDLSGGSSVIKKIKKDRGYLSNHEKYLYCRLLIRTKKLKEARKLAGTISLKKQNGFLKHVAFAEIEVAGGSYDKASDLYRAAANTGFDGGYYLAALCEMQQGNNRAAQSLLGKLGQESRYFIRGIEKRVSTLLRNGKEKEALKLISDTIAFSPGYYSVDRLNVLILLGITHINDENAEECLKTAVRIEQEIDGLFEETDTFLENYKDIAHFPKLSKIAEQYLSRKHYGQNRNRYMELSSYYRKWDRNTFLQNRFFSLRRAAIIYKNSILQELEIVDENIANLGKMRGKLDRAKSDLSKMRVRIKRTLDDYPIETLYEKGEGKKTNQLLQKKLEAIDQIDILGAEIESLIERVRNNPLYEKMDDGKKTVQKRAISEFFRIKKGINQLKVKAGLLQIRFTNLIKIPVIIRSRKLLKRSNNAFEMIKKASESTDELKNRLFAKKTYAQRQIEMSDEMIVRISGGLQLAKKIDHDLRVRYGELAIKPTEGIKKYLMGKRALLHYLKGRAYLLYRSKGENPPGQVVNSLSEIAYNELKSALDLGIYDEYRPECYYSMGEILMANEEETFAKRMEEIIQRENKGENITEPLIRYGESLNYFKKVIAEYPGSTYYENSLYSLAYAKNEMGLVDEGTEVYEELVEKFPQTRYSDEINMRIGEYYFNREDFKKAEISYKKVLGKTNREIYITSKFKLGWAFYNQDKYEAAVSAFLVPLKLKGKGKRPKFARLAEEAMNMIGKCYIEMGKIEEVGDPLAKAGLKSLIPAAFLEEEKILFETSRFNDVIKIAGILKKKYPYCIEILDSEDLAAKSYLKLLKDDDGHRRYYETILVFGPDSDWYRKNHEKKDWIERATVRLQENLRIAAYYSYRKGKEKGGKNSFKKAIEVFRNYLKIAPDSPYSTDIRYDLAYSLYEVGSYKSAMRIFEKVASVKTSEKLKEPSLYMAVQCAKALYEPDHPDTVDEIIRTARSYLDYVPSGERKTDVTLDIATAFFNGRMFESTVRMVTELENETKDTKKLSLAKRIKGESYFHMGKYGQAENAFRSLLKIISADERKEREKTIKFIGFSIFKNAQVLGKMGKLERASGEYLRLFKEFPQLDYSPIAALEGGKTLIQMGKTKKGKGIFEKIAKSYTGSPYEKEARRQIALLSEKSGDLEEAARNYRLIGEGLEKEPEGASYLKKAANLFFEMGSYYDAGLTFSRLQSNPRISTGTKIEAAYFAGSSFIKAGNVKKGLPFLKKAVKLNRSAPKKDKNIYHASLSQLEIASTDFDNYRKIQIKEPFEVTFKKKENYLKKLLESYVSIAKYGLPETLSVSLYQIGESYEEFRNSILAAPIPTGLSNLEMEEYIFLLEEKAAPYEEEAAKSHKSNVKKAAKFGYINEWVNKSWDKLKEIRGATYGRKTELPLIVIPMTKPLDFEFIREAGR